MTCERCNQPAVITLACTDARGPWLLCSPCWRDITSDNRALRASRKYLANEGRG